MFCRVILNGPLRIQLSATVVQVDQMKSFSYCILGFEMLIYRGKNGISLAKLQHGLVNLPRLQNHVSRKAIYSVSKKR